MLDKDNQAIKGERCHEARATDFRAVSSIYEIRFIYLRRRLEHHCPDAEALCGAGAYHHVRRAAGFDERGAQSARHDDRQCGDALRLPRGGHCGRHGLPVRHDSAADGGFGRHHPVLYGVPEQPLGGGGHARHPRGSGADHDQRGDRYGGQRVPLPAVLCGDAAGDCALSVSECQLRLSGRHRRGLRPADCGVLRAEGSEET